MSNAHALKTVNRARIVNHAAVKHQLAMGHPAATTAHEEVYRYYNSLGTRERRLSMVESIARCPSPFSVAEMLKDIEFHRAPEKTLARCRRAAAARLAELRGELYVEGA